MYTISYISQLLDIPAVTIRSWETRYHAVIPTRTEAGYRLFSDENIEDLRWLKAKVYEEGMTISQAALQLKQIRDNCSRVEAAAISPSELEAPSGVQNNISPGLRSVDSYPTDIHNSTMERLYTNLRSYQTAASKAELDLSFSMFGYETTICRILVPMMMQVGHDWETGILTVAQEHFITEFISQRCYGFFQSFPIDERMPIALAFCPSGELHHVGLLLFSLFLRSKGLDVIYLGPNTPDDGIAQIIDEREIDLVCMSIQDPQLLPDALKVIDCLGQSFPHLMYAFGGRGFSAAGDNYTKWLVPGGVSEGWGPWFDSMMKSYAKLSLAAGN
ncbi:cobalamin-dependent protein [Paenibacillus sp. NPDC058174]|uniref:MerR family transcriptional regulator n=1 Tax=Paenibacillus sp. NPDC058174 TaxID=3346366 RepID=UPI0036DB3BC1